MVHENSGNSWQVGYHEFLLGRLRLFLYQVAELPISARPFRLFTTSNDVISRRIAVEGCYEREVLGLIAALAERHELGTTMAIDAGANIGNHTVWLSQHFAQVVAVEPSPMMAHVLRANLLLNRCENVHVREVALGETRGSADLVHLDTGHLGTLELSTERRAKDAIRAVRVPVERGDDLLEAISVQLPKVGFVKIDIEGAEVAALRGLQTTLARDQPVVCFESRNEREGGQVKGVLVEAGYRYFYTVRATRMDLRDMVRAFIGRRWRKIYSLVEAEQPPEGHHAAIFAAPFPLQ